MKVLRDAVVGVALLAGVYGMLSVAQLPRQAQPTPGRTSPMELPPIDGRTPGEPPLMSPAILQQQEKIRNNERQRKMVDDTNKLLSLATDLKQQVSKGSKQDAATADDAAKKAEEIEKLARSVRDRMKG